MVIGLLDVVYQHQQIVHAARLALASLVAAADVAAGTELAVTQATSEMSLTPLQQPPHAAFKLQVGQHTEGLRRETCFVLTSTLDRESRKDLEHDLDRHLMQQ